MHLTQKGGNMREVTGQPLKSEVLETTRQIVEDESKAVETSKGERKVPGRGSSINETVPENHHPRS